jgi:hypothetical protein
MHEIRFQGITVIPHAIEDDIDDDESIGELMPPHVVWIPLISYSCTPHFDL